MLFDIQHYSVHDGPGIRTLVFLKGCPLRCRWCSNPESQRVEPELRHGRVRCQGCLRCVGNCPHGAVHGGGDGPVFDRERCRGCRERPCVEGCWQSALTVVGREWPVDEVVARVAKDEAFYRNSGGGVTFSGGEPFAQPRFLLEALRACQARGIHTAVETCGHADPEDLAAALPRVDLWLYDVKVIDDARHRELTGAGNARILANLRWLAEHVPERIVIRVPLVPGATDDAANLQAIAALAVELGIGRVALMPYHPMGTDKYAETGREPPPAYAIPEPRELMRAAAAFLARGLACEVE